jgi:23S rRNA (guanine2445-N2)-methyltransferase / 23S rRNA (guanine2069-N7)-methyltransferase
MFPREFHRESRREFRREWFINCPRGLESLLLEELQSLGAEALRETVAGVYAGGDLVFAYRVCLWSRLANRVLLPLGKFDVSGADDLYAAVHSVDWRHHIDPANAMAVDFHGQSEAIRHTKFGAQRVKDAIVDRLQADCGARPDVDPRHALARVNAHLARGRLALSLDLAGGSLHRRGYRVAMVPAPLKENLAAALLVRAGWPAIAERGGALIDPLCGSGTLLIEGAMMAADIAPGLLRRRFGFEQWPQHDQGLWAGLRDEAARRREQGLARNLPEIRGYDKDTRAVEAADANIAAAGLEKVVRVSAKPLTALKRPTHRVVGKGLLISNPPYGERWGDMEALRPLYRELGDIARREFPGWLLAVFTGNPELGQELRLRSDRKYKLFNGTIPAQLLLFSLRDAPPAETVTDTGPAPLSEGAEMFANRLRKNSRKLQSWLKRSGVTCYRLYDNDMPEYAVAVDIYGEAIHVQEYAPPATVDASAARRRLSEIRQALHHLYPASRERIVFKERRPQKGDDQYRPLGTASPGHGFVVREGAARLEVNLRDYLDTGLFLDHRPVRQMLHDMARGKRFLNLFCYTAAATVHAALGGAETSLSLDMSNTYLEWARRNFDLNRLDTRRHRLLRADCLEWLAQGEGQGEYDLIFLDPPTFSNSRKMEGVLDIQRDHPRLIRDAMAMLAPGGTLVFSNNFRRFRMDDGITGDFHVEDITARTIPPDFSRNPKIHNCWLIRASGSG